MASWLDNNVKYVAGVGEARAKLLEKELGILSIGDLLRHYPFRYIDRTKIYSIGELNENMNTSLVQLRARVTGIGYAGSGRKQRFSAGAVAFDREEAKFHLDEQGKATTETYDMGGYAYSGSAYHYYGGQLQTMPPRLKSTSHPGMELIRPMYLVKEEDILAWRDYHKLEFLQCACRFTEKISEAEDGIGESKRQEMKILMKQFRDTSKHIEMNIFRSVENVNLSTVVAYKKDGVEHHFLETYDRSRKFRKTKYSEIPAVMKLINQAKSYMKEQGIDQWQNGYPNEGEIAMDIAKGYSYVMEENGKIIGTMAVLFDGEPTYDKIYEGSWKTDEKDYVAIHRVAVDSECKGKGIAGAMIDEVVNMCREKGVRSIKNDTHKDNLSMQRMQAKNGFEYCGVIYLEDGAERIAFEKIVD